MSSPDQTDPMQVEEWNAKRKSVPTKHGTISYVEVGDGPAALFIHGAFLTGALWRNVIDRVAEDRRCIAIDLPAHGHTRISAGVDVSPRAHAEIFDELCGALDLETREGHVPERIEEQCRLVWANLTAALTVAAMDVTNLVKVTTFLGDRVYATANTDVRNEVLGDHRPALTVIVAEIWDPSWLIEIEAIAAG